MTWSRYNAIQRYREYHHTVRHLLTWIAVPHGYKPPVPPKSGAEAAAELRAMFPGGVIRGAGE